MHAVCIAPRAEAAARPHKTQTLAPGALPSLRASRQEPTAGPANKLNKKEILSQTTKWQSSPSLAEATPLQGTLSALPGVEKPAKGRRGRWGLSPDSIISQPGLDWGDGPIFRSPSPKTPQLRTWPNHHEWTVANGH